MFVLTLSHLQLIILHLVESKWWNIAGKEMHNLTNWFHYKLTVRFQTGMHHCFILLKQCPKCSLAFVPCLGPFYLSAGQMLYCPKKHAALCQNTIFSLSKLETCAHLLGHFSILCFICFLCHRLGSYILALLFYISLIFLSIGYHPPHWIIFLKLCSTLKQ